MTFEEAFFKAMGDRYDLDALSAHLRDARDEAGCVWADRKLVPLEAVAYDRVDAILWECLVRMFGAWQNTPRSGWVIDADEAAMWLDVWRERAGRLNG